MDAVLYFTNRVLAQGQYSLSSETEIVTGSIAVTQVFGLLNYHALTLKLESGAELAITPRCIEYAPGGPALLRFVVTPMDNPI